MQVVLVMFRGDGERRSFSVARDMTVIGRREDCDLRIPVGDVSRKHCRLVKEADTIRIEDLGSSNGTYVNSERVQEAVLNPGDVIQVGPVQFVLQIDGVPSEDEMAQPAAPAATSDDTATTLPPYPQMAGEELEELPAEEEPASLDALEEVTAEDAQQEPALEEIESADQLEEVEDVANSEEVAELEEVSDLEEVGDLEEVEAAPAPPSPPQRKAKPTPPPVPSRKTAAPPPPPAPPQVEEAEAEAPAGDWDFIVDDTANNQSHSDLNIEH